MSKSASGHEQPVMSMTLTYEKAVEVLAQRERFGMRPGLERIAGVLDLLGHPERRFAAIHIAGTNGKGATAALAAALLQAAGYRVGLYTSPHLVSPAERIAVQGIPISQEVFSQAVAEAVAAGEALVAAHPELGPATQFEVYTAAGFWAFAHEQVDVAVVEVGLGGRLDATNVLDPEVAVITPVGLDHTEILGPTLAQIAAEKAAIIKPEVAAVTAPQPHEAAEVIASRIAAVGIKDAVWVHAGGSSIRVAGALPVTFTVTGCDWQGTEFTVTLPDLTLADLVIPLAGAHQALNGAVALAAIYAFAHRRGDQRLIDPGAIRQALLRVAWPGRLETVAGNPRVVLDGAHNLAGARVLASALWQLDPSRPLVMVYGSLASKDWPAVLAELLPLADGLIATAPRNPRTPAANPDLLVEQAARIRPDLPLGAQAVADPQSAARLAAERAGRSGTVLVCGSLYLVGDVRPLWQQDWRTYVEK